MPKAKTVMEKIIQGGTLQLGNGLIEYRANDAAYAAFRCNDVSIFNYIESEKEFVREMHYFNKLQELETQITNLKQLSHA
jgi:hypothetical protein